MQNLDRFTDRARNVLTHAQEEARRLNHNYIGTEHLLLGLVREESGVAARVLTSLGVRLEAVRHEVVFVIGRGQGPVAGELSVTPRAKRVIELAVDEARRLKHHYIGTEHLLLGIVREGEGVAASVLDRLGVAADQVRPQIEQLLTAAGGWGAEAPPGPKGNVVTCRVDDRDLRAIDALIEAGIRSTRSDAAAWLIHAGIEAHRTLFERVYTTVAEIRRLRGEARGIADQLAGGVAPDAEPAEASPAETPPAGAPDDDRPPAATP